MAFLWLTVTAVVVTVGLLVVYYSRFPPQVPMWYSRPWGEDQLTSPLWLWTIPGLNLIVGAIVGLGSKGLQKDSLLLHLWTASGAVVQLILALALIRIVWLIIF